MRKDVRDMAGNRYAEGSVLDVLFALDGVPARYLSSVRTSGRPQRTKDDGEDLYDLA